MATIVDQINNAMSVLDTTITEKRKTNDDFKAAVKGKVTAIRALIAKIQSKFNELKNKQNQIGIVDAQMRKLEEENKGLRADLQKVTDLAQQHGVDKAELQKAHDVLKNKLIANDAAMKGKDNEKQGLQASLEKILTELQDKIDKLKQLTPGDADILNDLDQIQKELAALVGDSGSGPGGPVKPVAAAGAEDPAIAAQRKQVAQQAAQAAQAHQQVGSLAQAAAQKAQDKAAQEKATERQKAMDQALAAVRTKYPNIGPKSSVAQQGQYNHALALAKKGVNDKYGPKTGGNKTRKGGFRARYAKRDTSSSKRKTKKHHKHHKHHKRKHSRRTSKGRRSSSTRRSSSSR